MALSESALELAAVALEQAVAVLAAIRLARVQAQEGAQLPVAVTEVVVPRPVAGAVVPRPVAGAAAEPLLSAVQL